jgi:Domain of unknown function (DUF4272)
VTDSVDSAEPAVLTEAQRRRKRTEAYLAMWAVPATIPVDVLAVPTEDLATSVATAEFLRGRALAAAVLALRGQGLSQLESFAFADAYSVWDHFTVSENDFILTEEPLGEAMLNAAWSYERLWVYLWAFGLVRHLAFADTQVDTAVAIRTCISGLATAPIESLSVRPIKELLDGADVAWCSAAVIRAGATTMQPSVVHERAAAFDDILPGWRA